jgi:hypothetical protein
MVLCVFHNARKAQRLGKGVGIARVQEILQAARACGQLDYVVRLLSGYISAIIKLRRLQVQTHVADVRRRRVI